MSSVIVSVATTEYVPWVVPLVRSITRHMPDIPVMICGVGLATAECRRIEAAGRLVGVTPVDLITPGRDRRARTVTSRPYWLRAVLQENRWIDSVLLLDADTVLRRPIPEVFAALYSGSELAVVERQGLLRGKVYMRLRIAGGVLGVARRGIGFLDEWIAVMESNCQIEDVHQWEWFWDQICLFKAWSASDRPSARLSVPDYLSSPPFDPNAALWAANVKQPEKNRLLTVFRRESGSTCSM